MLKRHRVTLRAISKTDLQMLCEFRNDLELETSNGGSPPVPESLERFQSDFEEGLGGRDTIRFVIEVEGKLIGHCSMFGLNQFRGVAHSCELGIIIGDRAYWGRGFGREVITMLLDYAFQYWNIQRIAIRTHSANERAIKCYKACGFVEEGRLRRREWNNGRYVDTVCMAMLREEWEQARGNVLSSNSDSDICK